MQTRVKAFANMNVAERVIVLSMFSQDQILKFGEVNDIPGSTAGAIMANCLLPDYDEKLRQNMVVVRYTGP